jgi:hypothetical protein
MRILGYIVLTIGVALEVLVLVGELAEKTFNLTVSTRGIPFIAIGAYLVMLYGKGIGQRRKVAARVAGASVQPLTESQDPTLELPATAAISELISQHLRRTSKVLLMIAIGMAGFFTLVGAGIGLTDGSPDGSKLFFAFSCIGLCIGLTVGGIGSLYSRRLQRDVRESTYLRTSGPVELWTYGSSYMLRLADRAFTVDRAPANALRNVRWATVDHTRNAHLVLSVWDGLGNAVYCLTRGTSGTPDKT